MCSCLMVTFFTTIITVHVSKSHLLQSIFLGAGSDLGKALQDSYAMILKLSDRLNVGITYNTIMSLPSVS